MSLEGIIREALTQFVQSHLPDADLSTLDEVFFSYITGVLEELGSAGSSEEDFEMDSFVEMLEAYIPGFAEISSAEVYEMMFVLSGELSKARNISSNSADKTSVGPADLCSRDPGENVLQTTCGGAVAQVTQEDEANGKVIACEDNLQNGIDLLLEMFPSCSVSQAEKVLSMAKGDLEDAVQLLIEKKVKIDSQSAPKGLEKKEELKDFILHKYMMVDNEDDKRTHRPATPKEAPKKLIRYIDNQVVSTKGERYKDIKKPESEEMKKTYINLKPARKYKFH
ncbi:CUE domain-containing protein 2 isoform X1 [Bombina bombina]|uniref:CUE domain-containing protein 2 isoform X1 n=1 Tax=Bombina bombina TaxID=8345 RepID=UPI00235A86F8|nr:CUE domain-containing protein 2 isoform X1 [Bombina bombina]XP_053547925.1 CUE domain-containing protein 2 isoform X1 [Bombina bombina]